MVKHWASKFYLHWKNKIRIWSLDLANRSLVLCFVVGLIASFVLLARVPIVSELLLEQELHLQDQFFLWRESMGKFLGYRGLSGKDIVIVDIDSDSILRLGAAPRQPGHVFAALVKELHKAGAKVIALDVNLEARSARANEIDAESLGQLKASLPDETTRDSKPKDLADAHVFVKELKNIRNIVLATNVQHIKGPFGDQDQVIVKAPAESFVNALPGGVGSLGNTELHPDDDGVIRDATLIFSNYVPLGALVNSFALRIAERDWQNPAVFENDNEILLFERRYPVSFRINFIGQSGRFLVLPLWKALNWHQYWGSDAGPPDSSSVTHSKGEITTNPFRNKIVLVGYFSNPASEVPAPRAIGRIPTWPADNYWTPVGGMNKPMSGVEVQANIVANVLSNRYLSAPEWWEQVLIVIFIALLVARIFSGLHGRPFSMLAAVCLFAAVWLIDAFLCFVYLECLIPVMVPILGVAFPASFLVIIDQNTFAFQERRRHTRLFRNLASEMLAEEIDNRELGELGLEGKSATVTTLVCHIDNLGTITYGSQPEKVIWIVNQCLKEMIASVYEHNGIVNRIFNNGVLALWGAPITMHETSQARLAASCFLDIEKRMRHLSSNWQKERILNGQQFIECSVGIDTGEAICGRIGTETHSEYGAIGNSAELTMQFQSMARRYGVRCVIGEKTAQLLSTRFELRELDCVKCESSQNSHYIHQLICSKGNLPGAMEEVTAIYKQGLAAMEENDFHEAERLFATTLRMVPDDQPSLIMLNRCQTAIANSHNEIPNGALPMVNDE